jgi:hypothetical protein
LEESKLRLSGWAVKGLMTANIGENNPKIIENYTKIKKNYFLRQQQ